MYETRVRDRSIARDLCRRESGAACLISSDIVCDSRRSASGVPASHLAGPFASPTHAQHLLSRLFVCLMCARDIKSSFGCQKKCHEAGDKCYSWNSISFRRQVHKVVFMLRDQKRENDVCLRQGIYFQWDILSLANREQ
jgi:hypothetical protein